MLTDEQWKEIEKDCMIPTPKGWTRSVAERAYALGFAAGIEKAAVRADEYLKGPTPSNTMSLYLPTVIRELKP